MTYHRLWQYLKNEVYDWEGECDFWNRCRIGQAIVFPVPEDRPVDDPDEVNNGAEQY